MNSLIHTGMEYVFRISVVIAYYHWIINNFQLESRIKAIERDFIHQARQWCEDFLSSIVSDSSSLLLSKNLSDISEITERNGDSARFSQLITPYSNNMESTISYHLQEELINSTEKYICELFGESTSCHESDLPCLPVSGNMKPLDLLAECYFLITTGCVEGETQQIVSNIIEKCKALDEDEQKLLLQMIEEYDCVVVFNSFDI